MKIIIFDIFWRKIKTKIRLKKKVTWIMENNTIKTLKVVVIRKQITQVN